MFVSIYNKWITKAAGVILNYSASKSDLELKPATTSPNKTAFKQDTQ